MEIILPKILHLASTCVNKPALQSYLAHVGAPDWETDAPSDAELLVEVGGRECYRSFAPGLNKNVTKIREGNKEYIGNILAQRHGSVIEHAYDTYMFVDVSRVFTHELVRHRISNFSQESLRYVRLDQLRGYYPRVFQDTKMLTEEQRNGVFAEFLASFREDEERQVRIASILKLDDIKNFDTKKKLTSAMRRMAPIGLATTIMMTTNHRNWRFVIEQRTSRGAEEEIRYVFARVFDLQQMEYPNLYQDVEIEMVEGLPEIKFKNQKV